MKPLAIAAVTALGVAGLEKRHILSHDLGNVAKMLPYVRALRANVKKGKLTPDIWEDVVLERPYQNAVIYVSDEWARTWTYKELDQYANRVGNFLVSQGVKPGDDVALFMENRAEFIGIWLGITKIGAKVTMVNTAIKEKGLAHCFQLTKVKVIIYGKELSEAFFAIKPQLDSSILCFAQSEEKDLDPQSLDTLLQTVSDATPSKHLRQGIQVFDVFGYIFTSGTTGLPKAAIITHMKMLLRAGSGLVDAVPGVDVVYTVLPLFHSAAGVIGISFLMNGSTMVLRKRFSASKFFEDCAKYKATVVQYIGELCRYLLASPPGQFDRAHNVRVAIGNGLRPEIWREFQTRFNIPTILEFYGATEMNGILYNYCKTPDTAGFVGRLGTLGIMFSGVQIVKYSVETDELIRDKNGFCIKCGPNEVGHLIIEIRDTELGRFQGYSDKKATEKKIAQDVFKKGDRYFLSGDLLSRDERGYFRFVDRIGDTFRWKGENCSTMEVSEVVSTFPGILEANVYGVLVPNNQDGRAPCAAISCDESKLDFARLVEHLKKNLPSYAVPLFLRVTPQVETTATFKHQKVDLRNQGIDISKVSDSLYYLLDGKQYVRLTPELYAKICAPFAKL